ncbi:hypothetical protein [Aliirhizobium cellulosilyticum]|uniref:Uncharacterized protein n=1 Tax=Aliirhizobium cellulosilyticum TaxID=393664 RepID=A0A7W6SBK9_9HYPH|nr:hypothetical protein [Rhizobium cellulosilyticum]MBB4350759.1 hypothetical protein [Rhizobium cellulosilyticum]MBB4413953.1 hypothetical protein [Rhizobium cellulosilyticum]MBB4448568.1 hypothetical protein [Rhizobium cellulosilyticum]
MNRLTRDRRAQAQNDRKSLAKVEKAIAGIIAAIEDGVYQPSMKARMDDLERQKAEIVARLGQVPADMPDIHLNRADLYCRRVERLSDILQRPPDGGRQAAEALRSLIWEIVLTPHNQAGLSSREPTRRVVRHSRLRQKPRKKATRFYARGRSLPPQPIFPE